MPITVMWLSMVMVLACRPKIGTVGDKWGIFQLGHYWGAYICLLFGWLWLDRQKAPSIYLSVSSAAALPTTTSRSLHTLFVPIAAAVGSSMDYLQYQSLSVVELARYRYSALLSDTVLGVGLKYAI